ncbi:MAG: DUF2752 domain-containing protein [Bacteroidaceae bacterium]|nr:DUF2752 domain-containing protein [Bacteroidaceae bacterium]
MNKSSLYFLVIIAALLALYYVVDPSMAHFPIRCPLHELTGIQCPACGSQRALHAILHGEWNEALRFNAFFTIVAPIALPITVAIVWGRNCRLRAIFCNRYFFGVFIAVYLIWGVLRIYFES